MGLIVKLMNSGTLPGGQTSMPMVDGALTIGRGDENDLALPDPDRTLSKRHCVLEERNGDYVVIDISTNGTFLNYSIERLGNIPTPLNNGDVLQLGSYELVIEISERMIAPSASQPLPPAAESAVLPNPSSSAYGNQDINASLDDIDAPWDDIIGVSDPLQSPSEPSVGGDSWKGAAVADDPFAGEPLDNGPVTANLGSPDDPFAGSPIPDDFSLDDILPASSPDGSSGADHSPSMQDHFARPAVQSSLIPDDWDDLIAPAASHPAGASSPKAEPPEQKHQEQPQPPIGAAPVTPPAAPPPQASAVPRASAAGGTREEHAARAFLSAAGVAHLNVPEQELEETMARMGRVFAAMITGMREILMTRASIKSEMRMERTMINQGGNNPLKFSISPEQAIEAMIRPSVRGYLDAETATTEALNDIKAHEVAMMSGMEAALKDLLARLGPDQLSQRIESGSTLGGLLGGKKAKYWEAYEKMYAQIARETEDDFQSTFGREFARAYEEQLKKL